MSKRQQTYDKYLETGSVAETARQLGIHPATARYHIQAYKTKGPGQPRPDQRRQQHQPQNEVLGTVTFHRVEIWGPNLGVTGEQFHVHAKGCPDTQKGIYKRAGKDARWITAVESVRDLTEAVYSPQEFEYDPSDPEQLAEYAADVKIFPCLTLPQQS